MREQGGSRAAESTTGGDDCSGDKKDGRYDEFKLSGIGDELCTLETISLEQLTVTLGRGRFTDIIKCFGMCMLDASIENHNFSCSPHDAHGKYLVSGKKYFISDSKALICHTVFNNWVEKCSGMVECNQGNLQEEAVREFFLQRAVYLDDAAFGCRELASREKHAVEACSQTARDMRAMHEHGSGKKIKLVV